MALTALVAHGSTAQASDDFWKSAASGVWGNGANWLDGSMPGTSDAVLINQAGAYTISFNGTPPPIQALTVTNSANATFASASIFDLSTLRVTSASSNRDVLVTNDATLTLGIPGSLFQPDRPLHLTIGDELRLQSGATLNVGFGSDILMSGTLSILDGGILNVLGSGSTLSGAAIIRVGAAGVGQLNIAGGGSISSTGATLGDVPGTAGFVAISGSTSIWTLSEILSVGLASSGSLNIEAGGAVSSAFTYIGLGHGVSGAVTVTGTGSSLSNQGYLSVGWSGSAQLAIDAGGAVSNNEGRIAEQPGSSGVVSVTGPGSTWTNTGGLYVGIYDSGSLTIQAGGSVSSAFGRVGYSEYLASLSPTSTAVISGAGSAWTNSGELLVGGYSDGAMTISSAGSVSSNGGAIGDGAGISSEVANVLLVGNGTVTVTGPGSTWTNSGELYVGNHGVGAMKIESGGFVTSKNAAVGRIADRTHADPSYRYSSSGSVTVIGAGSSWAIDGRLSLGGDATLGTAGGTGALGIGFGGKVDITQDTVLFANSTLKLQGGTLATTTIDFRGGDFQWTSGTLHIGAYHRDLTNPAGGTLAPGRTTGTTTIHGSYTQLSGAALEIEIGGTVIAAEHDFVNVVGAAILAGELELKLIDDFMPKATDAFTVLNASGGIAGVFSNIVTGQRLTTSDGLGSFLVHYGATSPFNPNQIVLSAFERSLTPDFDDDGDVDRDDLLQWQGDFGQNGLSDADEDGDSDGADFLVWQRRLIDRADLAASVPEPGERVLWWVGAIALGLLRRQLMGRTAACLPFN